MSVVVSSVRRAPIEEPGAAAFDREAVIDRRAFLGALALLAAPLAAEAQPAGHVPRIGWLTSSVVHTRNVEAFRAGMAAHGYREVGLELRAAGGRLERLPELAAELLALKVDIIVTDGGPAAQAASHATSTTPIVIGATGADLVRQRLVVSLARPGRNVTGFTISTGPELHGKRLELLREAIPGLQRVAVVWVPHPDARMSLPVVEAAGKALRLQLEMVEVREPGDLERAFGSFRSRPEAILTLPDAFLWSQRQHVVSAAARHRLPGMYPEVDFAGAGGLMAYGPNVADNFRRAAGYVDKILKGANPAELPVERPSKFELVINLKTAKALGVAIPQSLLQRADQLIE